MQQWNIRQCKSSKLSLLLKEQLTSAHTLLDICTSDEETVPIAKENSVFLKMDTYEINQV